MGEQERRRTEPELYSLLTLQRVREGPPGWVEDRQEPGATEEKLFIGTSGDRNRSDGMEI